MTLPSFSELFSISLKKTLNINNNEYYFLEEIVEKLGPFSKVEIKKGKPPKFSKKTYNIPTAVHEICYQWMLYLKLFTFTESGRRVPNIEEINFLLQEEITFQRLKALKNYHNFIVFFSSYYSCNQFNFHNREIQIGQYLELEESLNTALYGKSGDPLLNDFICELHNRLTFNLTNYERFSKISQFNSGDLSPIDKISISIEIRKLVNLLEESKKTLNEELLAKLKSLTPFEFELFSLHLIASIAKTEFDEIKDMITHNGKVGDGGVDGIVKIRRAIGGFEQHFIQCKRYDQTSIGSPDVQSFVGAMVGNNANNGIFMTTSKFSNAAIKYSRSLKNQNIILIDGEDIVARMIETKLGVKLQQTKATLVIDEDFFNQFLNLDSQIQLLT